MTATYNTLTLVKFIISNWAIAKHLSGKKFTTSISKVFLYCCLPARQDLHQTLINDNQRLINLQLRILWNSWWIQNSVYGDISRGLLLDRKLKYMSVTLIFLSASSPFQFSMHHFRTVLQEKKNLATQ